VIHGRRLGSSLHLANEDSHDDEGEDDVNGLAHVGDGLD